MTHTAGTGTCRPRAPHPHVFDPLSVDPGERARCKACGTEQEHINHRIPRPRKEST